jgi:hypothetical protein
MLRRGSRFRVFPLLRLGLHLHHLSPPFQGPHMQKYLPRHISGVK